MMRWSLPHNSKNSIYDIIRSIWDGKSDMVVTSNKLPPSVDKTMIII